MFYGPGQQPGIVAPNVGRGAMPFGPQQGVMLPGMQGGRGGQFPGMQPQQGGRGAINPGQIPPQAFGVPGQMPFGAMPQGGPGSFPAGMAYPQALAQVQAQLGRGGQGGRGQIQGMQGLQGMPQQMMGLQGMRGRDSRPQQFPSQPGRGGMGLNIGMQPGQMGGFPQQGRGAMGFGASPQGMSQVPGAGAPSATLEALAAAPPNQQKQLLGEAIYPKIQILQPDLAGKITGMLLEMDNPELMSL